MGFLFDMFLANTIDDAITDVTGLAAMKTMDKQESKFEDELSNIINLKFSDNPKEIFEECGVLTCKAKMEDSLSIGEWNYDVKKKIIEAAKEKLEQGKQKLYILSKENPQAKMYYEELVNPHKASSATTSTEPCSNSKQNQDTTAQNIGKILDPLGVWRTMGKNLFGK